MAVIYLVHPDHGAKVACSDIEAQMDFANGWEKFDPSEPVAPVESIAPATVEAVQEPVNSLASGPRRGRPRKTT